MHWWQNDFSSSSSPSPSSAKSHSDDILLNRSNLKSYVASFFSFRGGGRSGSGFGSQQRRLTRARKLRHLTDDDLCVSGSPLELPELRRSPSSFEHYSSPRSSSSSASPQPLPLPELAVMLRRDRAAALASNHFNANSIPLPSPKEAPNKGREERERADALNGHGNGDGVTSNAGFGSRLSCQDARRNTEHAETQPSRKSTRELNGAERLQNKHRPNILVSAPVSPFSSPALSPKRNMGDFSTSPYMFPQALQAWSAPEMPLSDMTLGLGSPYQIFLDKAAFSVDNSPLHSPRVSPHLNIRSPSGPPSPLHNKLSIDTSVVRRESNAQANIHPLPREISAQANVHPLPLPPGAAVASQPAHSPEVTAKSELMPRKSQWQKGKLIGRGTFGIVYVASNRETGALCAMKEVELLPDDPQSTECIRQLEQEIKVLSKLKHPNIVQYYGSEIVDDRFYIYLEYVHPGSINRYIHDHCGSMTESVVRNFTRHILCGLAYLHSTKTIHRDIKGANLLVDANGVVKLADFGMAKHLTGQAANLSLKGSPYWMAPELLQSVMQPDASPDLALAIDIWSLGCTIIEMMDGKPPWGGLEGPAAMFKVLKETPPIPETMSPEGKDFLRCCFRRNPAERPSASMLLEHRFLKNPQQLDLVSCTQSLNGMKLKDKAHTQRERPGYKLDQLPVSAKEAQSTKRKIANTETGQRSHHETSNLVGVHHHSPRSTLDVLPSLSPPRSSHNTDHSSPFAVVPSSMKQGAKKNHYFQ